MPLTQPLALKSTISFVAEANRVTKVIMKDRMGFFYQYSKVRLMPGTLTGGSSVRLAAQELDN